MKNTVHIMIRHKRYRLDLNNFATFVLALFLLIATSVMTLDATKHPERYSTIYRYQSSIHSSVDW